MVRKTRVSGRDLRKIRRLLFQVIPFHLFFILYYTLGDRFNEVHQWLAVFKTFNNQNILPNMLTELLFTQIQEHFFLCELWFKFELVKLKET